MNGWTHLNSKVKTVSVTVKDLEGMFLGLILSVCRQFLSRNFLFCEITTRVPTLWIPARLKCDVTCINHSGSVLAHRTAGSVQEQSGLVSTISALRLFCLPS